MIKHTDHLGRIVIPKFMRKIWQLPEGEKAPVEMTVIDEQYILLSKYREKDRCDVCGRKKEDLLGFRDDMGLSRNICASCMDQAAANRRQR